MAEQKSIERSESVATPNLSPQHEEGAATSALEEAMAGQYRRAPAPAAGTPADPEKR
jgi:hypothetical protein